MAPRNLINITERRRVRAAFRDLGAKLGEQDYC